MLRLVVAVLLALGTAWVVLLIALAVARPDGATLRNAASVLPDTVRLVRRLATDETLPRSVRRTLWVLAGYLVLPFDLVPDFIPVLGYADDAIVVAIALRRVVRVAGADAIERHWTGSPVRRLAGVR